MSNPTGTARNNRFVALVSGERELTLAVQETNAGEIDVSMPELANRYTEGIPYPGDAINYNDLVLTFLIDEKFDVWFDVLKWIDDVLTGKRGHETIELILHDAQHQPVKSIVYHNAIPTNLSQVQMSITSDEAVLQADIRLLFSHFTVQDKLSDREVNFYE